MNRRGFLKATAASALSCAILAACAQEYATLRYRLRIVVEIDGRQYEGASVAETQFEDWRGLSWVPAEARRIVSYTRGEAIIVDLREHGLLFGLLLRPVIAMGFNSRQPEDVLARCLPPPKQSDEENLLKNIQVLEGECELRASDRPVLVRFRNIEDPSSVELVQPERLSDVYGVNAAFVRATIAVTDDPVTDVIEQKLSWLSDARLAAPDSTLVGKLSPGFRAASSLSLAEGMSIHHFKFSGE